MTRLVEDNDHPPGQGLGINMNKACFVIAKAHAFDVKEGGSDPDLGSNPTDDSNADVQENLADDAT